MRRFDLTITALVTPFKNGQVDVESLERLVRQQLEAGIESFVINGTTAESPTLEDSEVEEIFGNVRGIVGPDFPLILGIGSNSTKKTIEWAQKAQAWKAQGVLVVVPYYNKPPQRGLVAHFKAVAESTTLPVILYNVPGRTVTSLDVDSIKELSKVKNIVGLKEASGKIDFAHEIVSACGEGLTMLSGDDGTYVEFLNVGGHGVISVATHVIPQQMLNWKKWIKDGELERARTDIKKHSKLIDLLFCEANPIPVKMALYKMGLIDSPELRLPLMILSEKWTTELVSEMKELGLIQ